MQGQHVIILPVSDVSVSYHEWGDYWKKSKDGLNFSPICTDYSARENLVKFLNVLPGWVTEWNFMPREFPDKISSNVKTKQGTCGPFSFSSIQQDFSRFFKIKASSAFNHHYGH